MFCGDRDVSIRLKQSRTPHTCDADVLRTSMTGNPSSASHSDSVQPVTASTLISAEFNGRPDRTLPADLENSRKEIEEYCKAEGLDFFPVIYIMVERDEMCAVAARGGFPTRYPHWKFGMEYEKLQKSHAWGQSKIYEMVINNDPCYAYLQKGNLAIDQKMVMAHVYGHCHFFKNNPYFEHTNRNALNEFANHGQRIKRYVDKYGLETVEQFLDTCLSIEDLIDPHSTFIQRTEKKEPYSRDEEDDTPIEPGRLPSKSYMDRFINPPEELAKEREYLEKLREQEKNFPEHPLRDIMGFVLDNTAHLEDWQRDILSIIREEAYYFVPQGQTKIMNEGWASYWHTKLIAEKIATDSDVIDAADHTSGTLAKHPQQINPYALGIALFRDIVERWKTGRHGLEYEECKDREQKKNWNTVQDDELGARLAKEKIFQIVNVYNDVGFIDEFFTYDFCRDNDFFSIGYNEYFDHYEIVSREYEKVKASLLQSLENFGRPAIYVRDGNYQNRGELLLEHRYVGTELDANYMVATLENLNTLWARPVNLVTYSPDDESFVLYSYDGEKHSHTPLPGYTIPDDLS